MDTKSNILLIVLLVITVITIIVSIVAYVKFNQFKEKFKTLIYSSNPQLDSKPKSLLYQGKFVDIPFTSNSILASTSFDYHSSLMGANYSNYFDTLSPEEAAIFKAIDMEINLEGKGINHAQENGNDLGSLIKRQNRIKELKSMVNGNNRIEKYKKGCV